VFKEKSYIVGRISLFTDVGITALSLWISFFGWWLLYQVYPFPKEFYFPFFNYSRLYMIIIPVIPLIYDYNGLYQNVGFRSKKEILHIIAKSQLIALFALIALFFLRKAPMSRVLIFGFIITNGSLTFLKEMLILERLNLGRQLGRNFKNVVLVGYGEIAKKVIKQIKQHIEWGLRIVGVVVPEFLKEEKTVYGYKVLGIYDRMGQILRGGQYDQVIFAVQKRYLAEAEGAIYACETQGVETWLIADFFKTSIARISLGEFQHLPMMVFSTTPEYSWQLIIKSAIDKIGALVGFIITLPIFVAVSIIIKITSPGPIFFKQKRLGLRGKEFTMLKFRSMINNAEQLKSELQALNEMDQVVFKIANDPRITPIGRFIRKTSIDELPQFINVLKGDMSLVGPRPMLRTEIEEFQEWQRRKLSVKPGLTCLWQISGRSDTTFEQWMELDLDYIDNWSLWLDLQILFKTIPVVLFSKGAK